MQIYRGWRDWNFSQLISPQMCYCLVGLNSLEIVTFLECIFNGLEPKHSQIYNRLYSTVFNTVHHPPDHHTADKKHYSLAWSHLIIGNFLHFHSVWFSGVVGAWRVLGRKQAKSNGSSFKMSVYWLCTWHWPTITLIIFDQTEAGWSGLQLLQRDNGRRCNSFSNDLEDSVMLCSLCWVRHFE